MIRFGPAGIPLSCKGRTLKDGIEDVHNLSLTALEIQMVKSNTIEMYPEEEDVGMQVKDFSEGLVVEIIRDDEPICDPEAFIEEDDILITMMSGVTDRFSDLYVIGNMARRLDVSVSLHTPNYIDLGPNSPIIDSCLDSMRYSGLIVNALGGNIVTTNLGLYNGDVDEEEVDNSIYDNIAGLMDWWHDVGLRPKLGIEITGQENVFGSLDQVLDICDQIEGLVPVVNWSNYHSRTSGSLLEPEDFEYVIEQVEPYCPDGIHSLFSGVESFMDNEARLTPIKKGTLKFDSLAECLVEKRPEMTIISSSPLLEHDAMYMRIIYERSLNKKIQKVLRQKRKEAEAAAAASAEGSPEE